LTTKIFKEKQIVMDVEKFFYLFNTSIPGNDVYYTSDKSKTPADVKFKLITKIEDKILIWAAISGNGQMSIFTNRSISYIWLNTSFSAVISSK
jgi:hypothetical protein